MKITRLLLFVVLFSQGLCAATLKRGLGAEPDSLDIHQAQGLPVIPLYFYVSRHLIKTNVSGYRPNIRDIHLSRYLGVKSESP